MHQYGQDQPTDRRHDIGPDGVPEYFAEAVGLRLNPFGSVLTFSRRDASRVGVMQPGEHDEAAAIPAVRVRLTLEHMKAMTMIFYKSVLNFEREYSIKHDVADQMLASMEITRDQWDLFWGHTALDTGGTADAPESVPQTTTTPN